MDKDRESFRKRFLLWKKGEKVYDNGNKVPFEDKEYNYYRANKLGYTPDETGHMPSRDYETGMYLKKPTHPTIMKSIISDLGEGYIPVYNKKDGQIYSHRWPDDLPKYGDGKIDYSDTINFLKKHEGFRDSVYLDGNGIPTIGYGFTDQDLIKKGTITRAEADARLIQELLERETILREKIKNWDNLSSGSKTALRSYYYNYPAGFKDTTKFMLNWNAGNYIDAIKEVDAGMNDKNNRGLRVRRLEELKLLMNDPLLIPVDYTKPQIKKYLESIPKYLPQLIYLPPTTLYPINPLLRTQQYIDSWSGADSPSAGGRLPSILLFMLSVLDDIYTPTFKLQHK